MKGRLNKFEKPILKFKKLNPNAIIPKYHTKGAAAFDLHALLDKDVFLLLNERMIICTGLAVSIPENYELLVSPRSGHSFNSGITILNSPGIIDQDYISELKVVLFNTSHILKPFRIRNGDRIAQVRIKQSIQAQIVEVEEFSKEDISKDRGGGFGSTGL